MFTGKQLAAYCEKAYAAKWVYWYGTFGLKCTEALYKAKAKQYPAHYTAKRQAGYMKEIAEGRTCADCVGLIKSFFWAGGRFGAAPKYASNNCPDTSADGMIKLCAQTGKIGTIPDEPGLVVWKSGHIGVYIGGGYTVEMRGYDYDCVKRKVSAGPWTKWGRLPASMISYGAEAGSTTGAAAGGSSSGGTASGGGASGGTDGGGSSSGGTASGGGASGGTDGGTLRRGDRGEAVRALQKRLIALGYSCGSSGADGDFGAFTETAVRRFQQAHGLADDGIAGPLTMAAIRKAEGTEEVKRWVRITGTTVNVRAAPGLNGTVIGTVKQGDRLPYGGVTRQADGRSWHLIDYKNRNGWVSGRFAEVE